MNLRHGIYILLLILIIPVQADAQRWKLQRYRASLGVSATLPFMDIGASGDGIQAFCPQGTRPGATLGLQFLILENLSAGLDLAYLNFGASENGSGRVVPDRFTTHAFEHIARADYTVIGGRRGFRSSTIFNRRGMVNNFGISSLYVYAGAGGILSKAKAVDINGDEIIGAAGYYNNLQWGAVIPAGIGYRFTLDDYFNLSAEVGGRLTLTDKLDGYHTEFSNYNDRYFVITIKGIYKIKNDSRGRPVFNRYRSW